MMHDFQKKIRNFLKILFLLIFQESQQACNCRLKNITSIAETSKFHKKKAPKEDFWKLLDPFWGFRIRKVPGIHDYPLEPKITKCRDPMY